MSSPFSAAKSMVRRQPVVADWRRKKVMGNLTRQAIGRNLRIEDHSARIAIRSNNQVIYLAREHFLYAFDVINDFGYYFSAVEPEEGPQGEEVDYSRMAVHVYRGFSDYGVLTPTLAEPLATAELYVSLAGASLGLGATVVDLGSYSGLTAILFKRLVGNDGKVVAVEADPVNALCSRVNFQTERLLMGTAPTLHEGAIWSRSGTVHISSESSMGTGVTEFVGVNRGPIREVRAITLSNLVEAERLESVDFLKVDIEGAEAHALSDERFFGSHSPTVIVEIHSSALGAECKLLMERYGYSVTPVSQPGTQLDLLLCMKVPDDVPLSARTQV